MASYTLSMAPSSSPVKCWTTDPPRRSKAAPQNKMLRPRKTWQRYSTTSDRFLRGFKTLDPCLLRFAVIWLSLRPYERTFNKRTQNGKKKRTFSGFVPSLLKRTSNATLWSSMSQSCLSNAPEDNADLRIGPDLICNVSNINVKSRLEVSTINSYLSLPFFFCPWYHFTPKSC